MAGKALICSLALGSSLVGVAACDPPLRTDRGQLGLGSGDLFLDSTGDAQMPPPVVAGSHYCPDIQGWYDADGEFRGDEDVARWFDISAAGAATLASDGCLDLGTPGVAVAQFSARAASGFVDDSLTFEVLDPAAVELRYDAFFLRHGAAEDPGRPLAPGAVPGRATEIAIATDSDVPLLGSIFVTNTGDVAAWNHEEFWISPVAGEPELLPLSDDPEVAALTAGAPAARVRMAEGDEVELHYRASGNTFISQSMGASTPEEATSLRLVALYDGEAVGASPRSVHAIVDDTRGRRVVGAPITWTIEGPDLHETEGFLVSPDLLELDVECTSPTATGTAVVVATYAGMTASVDVGWDCSDEALDDDATLPSGGDGGGESDHDGDHDDDGPLGLGGCLCTSTGAPGGPAPFMLLLLVVGVTRRRRAQRTSQ